MKHRRYSRVARAAREVLAEYEALRTRNGWAPPEPDRMQAHRKTALIYARAALRGADK